MRVHAHFEKKNCEKYIKYCFATSHSKPWIPEKIYLLLNLKYPIIFLVHWATCHLFFYKLLLSVLSILSVNLIVPTPWTKTMGIF